ncbi:MAG: hypothetical protein AABW81_03620 [Nanoarchaeota archaeon]
MKTVDLSKIVKESDILVVCPSAVISHLTRNNKGPSTKGQDIFMKELIDYVNMGEKIFTTKGVTSEIFDHPGYREHIYSNRSTEEERKNYRLIENFKEALEKNNKVLDLENSKDLSIKCHEDFSVFYGIAKTFLDQRDEKNKKK